jgi:hypothetical protein
MAHPHSLGDVQPSHLAQRLRRLIWSSHATIDRDGHGYLTLAWSVTRARGLYERPSGKRECRLCRQSESSRKGIQRPTTQRRVADTRAAHARAS